jgi:cell division topological specificity factor
MSVFDRLGIGRRESARVAKDRLQILLVHDRAGLTPGRLEALKDDLIDVLSRYVEIDRHAAQIKLTKERDQQRLVADIPLAPPSRRRRFSD